ncbi:HNH endonuclease [Cellulosimicrobium cellulans]|uniref:HNH endonuclease n=1 Tax=Cellulosimicrobium cellulans TaxID=1710 RepID=UPI00130EFDFA|nr:HNH endonuclease [Cellulosimicrobium cellulans]
MMRQFWSCFSSAAFDESTALYGDVLGTQYEYDSNVINHRGIGVGDVLLIRDAQLVHGYGVVEDVTTHPDVKTMRRCPRCRSADIAPRKRLLPVYRCNDCKHTFDQPIDAQMEVLAYAARYSSSWYPFDAPARVRDLDGLYVGRDRQNAIRRLDPAKSEDFLLAAAGLAGILNLQIARQVGSIPAGHLEAVARIRRGQRQFRDGLLDRFGSTCAVTGRQPDDVLDAAHLYRYSERAVHQLDGGLLLRSDVHRMFDRLLLTFDPVTWTSRVAPPLLDQYEGLRVLDAQPIAVAETMRPDRTLVEEHFGAAIDRWKQRWRAPSERRSA